MAIKAAAESDFVSHSSYCEVMAKKRTYCEIENLGDLYKSPTSNTEMHGAVFFHIACKEMKTVIFFDGTLTDPTSRLRLMGFDCLQQRKLQEMHKKTSTEFTSTLS